MRKEIQMCTSGGKDSCDSLVTALSAHVYVTQLLKKVAHISNGSTGFCVLSSSQVDVTCRLQLCIGQRHA